MSPPVLVRKAGSFLRQPGFVQLWFVPVWALLGLSKLLIRFIPFRVLAPRLGIHAGIFPWLPLIKARQEQRALQIGRVIRMTSRYTPWDSNCFPQAMTARMLLSLYGIPYIMFFGLARGPTSPQMDAHAWVATGRIKVTGGASFNQFTVVSCFVSACLAPLA